jgi:hypothetical protein
VPRIAAILVAFVGGVLATLIAIYLLLRTAPGIIAVEDAVSALTVAASRPMSSFRPGDVVYVKSSFGTDLIEKLHATNPSLRLLPYAARPADDGCKASANLQPMAPCERNDFIVIDALSSPTSGTMLVGFSVSNAFGQMLLVKFGGQWRVAIDRGAVI